MSTDPRPSQPLDRFVGILGFGIILIPLLYNPLGGHFLPLKRLAIYALVIALGVTVGIWKNRRWTTTPVTHYAILYVAISILSTLWAVNPYVAMVEATHLVALLIIFLLTVQHVDHDGFVRLSGYATAAGGVVAALGCAEYLGLDRALLEALSLESIRIPSAGRPSATLGFRNIAASFLIGCIPLVCLNWHHQAGWKRRLSAITVALMALLLIYTRTRGAWVGLIVGTAAALAYTYRQGTPLWIGIRPSRIALPVILVIGLSALPPDGARSPQQFDTVKETPTAALASVVDPGADRGRLTFWKNTVSMIVANPVLGVGLNNWQFHYPVYDQGEATRIYSEPIRPHNDLIWIWSELGPIGLLAFLGMALLPVAQALRRNQPRNVATTAACVATVIGLIVHGCFSFLREQPTASLFLWLGIAGLTIPHRTETRVTTPWVGAVSVAFGILAVGLGLRHVGFDRSYHVAKAFYDAGNRGPALQVAREARDVGSFDHRASFLEARILHSAGRSREAVGAYREALREHPNYANTHHNLAGVLVSLGDVSGALPHFRRALEIRPTYHEARINLANTLAWAGQLPLAKREVETVIQLTDRVPEAYSLLGAILLQEGNPKASVRALVRAIELEPESVEAHNNLAVAYEQAGKPAAALESYRVLERIWKSDPAYLDTIREQIRRLERSPQ